MKGHNAQQATEEFRALNDAETEAVSGAKENFYDFGPLGVLGFVDGCAIWTMGTTDGKGGFTLTTVGQC